MTPVQLCFDIFYDDKLIAFFEERGVDKTLAYLISLIPELILLTDILLKFITGYYENGVIIQDKQIIFSHYIKKGLLSDIIICFPVIFQGFFRDYISHLAWLLQLFQLMILLNLKRVKAVISNYQESFAYSNKSYCIISACKLMYVIIFIAHINACIFHAVAYYAPKDISTTWLDYSGLRDVEWSERYVNVLYWSVSVMATIGFGEKISPRNNLECTIGSLILIVSLLLSGYCINTMKELVDIMTKDEQDYK